MPEKVFNTPDINIHYRVKSLLATDFEIYINVGVIFDWR